MRAVLRRPDGVFYVSSQPRACKPGRRSGDPGARIDGTLTWPDPARGIRESPTTRSSARAAHPNPEDDAMHPISKGFMIATAVATMAIGGSLQAMAQDKAQSEPVKCAGLNACKGQGAARAPATTARARTPARARASSRRRLWRTATSAAGPQEVVPVAIAVPYLGHGVGLRPQHFPRLWDGTARVDWFEAISENFMIAGRPAAGGARARPRAGARGAARRVAVPRLDRSARRGLSRRARGARSRAFEPAWVSDHLCWGSVGGHYAHDLLPLPYTEEALAHVVGARRRGAGAARPPDPGRERLELPHVHATRRMTEWEFLAAVAERADCGILLDVNNVYVSAVNHGFDARGVPRRTARRSRRADPPRRPQRHGHAPARHPRRAGDRRRSGSSTGSALRRFGRVSTLVEWDEHIPELDVVLRRGGARARRRGRGAGGRRCCALRELQLRFLGALRPRRRTADRAALLAAVNATRRPRRRRSGSASTPTCTGRASSTCCARTTRASPRSSATTDFAALACRYLTRHPSDPSVGAPRGTPLRRVRSPGRRPSRHTWPTWLGSSGRASRSSTRRTPSRFAWPISNPCPLTNGRRSACG